MARSTIKNPFKEDRIHWIRYLAIIIGGFLMVLLFLVFGGTYLPFLSGDSNSFSFIELREKSHQNKKEGSTANNNYHEEEDHMLVPTVAPTVELFPMIDQDDFPNWMARYYTKLEYKNNKNNSNNNQKPEQEETMKYYLTRRILHESLQLGCNNIRHNQKPEGNFNYMYDFVSKTMDPDDNPVRQAGALWGLVLCFQNQPDQTEWQQAVEKGIHFFGQHLQEGPIPGSTMVAYPGYEQSETGTNALFGLALIDYLRTIQDHNITIDPDMEQTLKTQLTSIIQFLKFMQLPNQSFAQSYHIQSKNKAFHGSPYFDGEAMLCWTKAARYLDGYTTLIPLIEQTAMVLAKRYTLDEWREIADSDKTKGFYQWSSMFLWEYWHAKWKDYEVAGDYVMVVAHWMINVHRILQRPMNTGYAFEGMVCAYDVALLRGYGDAFRAFERTIDQGLYKLGQWQVGGPLAHLNLFLRQHPTDEDIAVGGILNSRHEAPLRIDTTQHQMHAVMMAMEFIYTAEDEMNELVGGEEDEDDEEEDEY
jgi:hypothetical protein